MVTLLSPLGVELPVLAAPMAGGVGRPELAVAAAEAGSLGFVAAGYLAPDRLLEQIAAVRATGAPFGVNVFAPNPVPVDAVAYRTYADALFAVADELGVTLPAAGPIEDDDAWNEKVEALVADPVQVVTFTFGVPEAALVRRLRAAGTIVGQTVTAPDEAVRAQEAGVDLLVVQGASAGGHSATLAPERFPRELPTAELVRAVRRVAALPIAAAGGLSTAEDVAGIVTAGAELAVVGTALLRADESGTSAAHRGALTDPASGATVLTRSFTGRPARAIRNRFIAEFDALAPSGYPALHHLTSPIRRAAAAAGEAGLLHLWAGTGYRLASEEPAAQTLGRLAGSL